MDRLFDESTYQLTIYTLPFAVAFLVMLGMGVYVALMRGAPLLRFTYLAICVFVLVFLLGMIVMSASTDERRALLAFKLGLAPTVLAGYAVLLFDLALARRLPERIPLLVGAGVVSIAMTILCATTDLVFDGIWTTPSGVMFGTAGPIALAHTGCIGLWVGIGSFELWRNLDTEPSPIRRRQFKGAMWAFSICSLGVADILLSYRIGYSPVSWLFLTIGAVIAIRSLVLDDLVHAGSLDERVPRGISYLVIAGLGVMLIALSGATPAMATLGVVFVFVTLRAAASILTFLSGDTIERETPLDRALSRYSTLSRAATTPEELAGATAEILDLAIGSQRIALLIPSEEDYSWSEVGGDLLPEPATPDPLILGWLAENPRALTRDALIAARLGDLRQRLERLFENNDAEVLLPLVSRDEVVGMLAIASPPGGRTYRAEELKLLESVREHASMSIVYAAMYRETTRRVEVAKEVELAATVQQAFVPTPAPINLGAMRLSGMYAPASRCGGDWWSAQRVPGGRVLVLIGDVTGHGLPAAMVTAAAKGCCDVAVRLMGDSIDLVRLLQLLHKAVKRTGGTEYHMTCFATLIDPASNTITYANAGHVVPYVCTKTKAGKWRLDVLVARGNPLGASESPTYKEQSRQLADGDVIVWYTDGVVECTNPTGQQFGDRRFQRMLRTICDDDVEVDTIRDTVLRQAVTFHEGHPPDDDITLVVGRFRS